MRLTAKSVAESRQNAVWPAIITSKALVEPNDADLVFWSVEHDGYKAGRLRPGLNDVEHAGLRVLRTKQSPKDVWRYPASGKSLPTYEFDLSATPG